MLETPRLILKPLTHSQLLKYLRNDHSLEEELNLNQTSRVVSDELKEALEKVIIPNVTNTEKNYLYCTMWTAILKSDRKMIGDLCFVDEPNEAGETEVGYGTYNEFQGKGYMSEMLGGIIQWARTQPKIRTILASTDNDNAASIKVLQKNNFILTHQSESSFSWKLELK